MIPQDFLALVNQAKNDEILLRHYVKDENNANDEKTAASNRGAFPYGSVITWYMAVPRHLLAEGVVIRLAKDGHPYQDIPLAPRGEDERFDFYTLSLDLGELCRQYGKEQYGLFFYEFLILRGVDTLFTDSVNNVDFTISERNADRFRLLVYEPTYRVPSWFGGGVMYHVFVDRFCRGKGEVSFSSDSELNEDWDNGIPQYAPYPGAPLANNMCFGGNLWGVAEKIPYLAELGVTVIYLSPIFKAYSNHKYDTGDYMKVDPAFGGEEAFEQLLKQAKEAGIRIVLDGVFNHTGDDSLYFNRYGKYDSVGAYQSTKSPYYSWYHFKKHPDSYESWWGIEVLPKLNSASPACMEYLVGKDGVVAHYTKAGIGGWRLDVADELSDEFLDRLRETVKENSCGEGIVIGEVWENAADKIAYGKRRRYLCGRQLDSVMNYPFRNAVLAFLQWGDGEALYDTLTDLYSSYPKDVCDSLMNIVGTHDTERIHTLLGCKEGDADRDNATLAMAKLSDDEKKIAEKKQRVAAVLQYTVYGIPSVFYGDEIGMEGYHDPFCRMPFPWSRLDEGGEMLSLYRRLGKIRALERALDHGDFAVVSHGRSHICYRRGNRDDADCLYIVANAGEDAVDVTLPKGSYRDLLREGADQICEETVSVPSFAAMVLKSI